MSNSELDSPLTAKEIADLRLIMEKDRRMVWVWATLRVWAGWFAAAVSFYFVAKAMFADLLARFLK